MQFDGALTLTHHATDLILPGGANITTAAGDVAVFTEYASGDWRCVSYQTAADAPGGVTVATPVATTSGTAVDFTGIPAGTKRIDVILHAVSLSGTDNILIQLGDSGGFETAGYASAAGEGTSYINSTAGFIVRAANASYTVSGVYTLWHLGGNDWVGGWSGQFDVYYQAGGGNKTLSAELDRLRFTPTGANTFDAGEVTIAYY